MSALIRTICVLSCQPLLDDSLTNHVLAQRIKFFPVSSNAFAMIVRDTALFFFSFVYILFLFFGGRKGGGGGCLEED